MTANKKCRIIMIILVLALAALIAGIYTGQHVYLRKNSNFNEFQGTLLQPPRTIKSFSLTGIDRQVFNNQSLQKKWTLIFFGFTNCGYVCPTTMAELAKMYRLLQQQNIQPLPQVVMISIDPDRDTLDKIKRYVTQFNPAFFGARGDNASVKNLADELGIAYSKIMPENVQHPANYDVQHSGAIMLFNPQGKLSAFFTNPHQAESMIKDYQLLIKNQ